MPTLPPAARTIDPSLQDVGLDMKYQELVFGSVDRETLPVTAFLVARLTQEHPEGVGIVGHYYGTILRGFEKRGSLRFFSCVGTGEVVWKDDRWRPLDDHSGFQRN